MDPLTEGWRALDGYDTLYNIAAKAERDGTPTKEAFSRMLQTLSAEPFHLEFQLGHERDISIYLPLFMKR